jgi:hypothetical protein
VGAPCNPRNLPDLEPADHLRCSSYTQTRFSSEQEWSDSSPIAQSDSSFCSRISTLPSTYFASEPYSLPICLQFITWLPIQLSWVRSAVLTYHHKNRNNGKQEWKHYANLLKPGAASPDIGPNLDPFGSRQWLFRANRFHFWTVYASTTGIAISTVQNSAGPHIMINLPSTTDFSSS